MHGAARWALGLMAALALLCTALPGRAHDAAGFANSAPQKNPLFLNMTSGDSWRGGMGLQFAHDTLKLGHPVAVFLNLDAVKLAAKAGTKHGRQKKQKSMQRLPREILADFMRDGGIVLVCGPCMAAFGLSMDALVPGVKMARPGYTQSFIFSENARTLNW